MKIRAIAAAVALAVGTTFATAADKPVRWNMRSWFPSKLPQAGSIGRAMLPTITAPTRASAPRRLVSCAA